MNFSNGRRYRAIGIAALLAYVTCALFFKAVKVQAGTPFAFLVVGDTRTEPYLTGGQEQACAFSIERITLLDTNVPVEFTRAIGRSDKLHFTVKLVKNADTRFRRNIDL